MGVTDLKEKTMPKAYVILWSVITAAYAVMMFCIKNTVLVTFESEAARTVDGIIYPDITGMIGRHWLYPVWAVFSVACLALFIVYIKKFLYGDALGKFAKYFCMAGLIFDFVFITWYALMGDRYQLVEKAKDVTSSMLGLDFPWHFRMWGVFTSAAVFTNTLYAFRKHNFNSKVGVILGSIGSAAIFMTINLPSVGKVANFADPRCLFHWLGALLFAFFCAAPLGIFLFCRMREGVKPYKALFIGFIIVVIVMTALLVLVGKSALIENLPIWAAYAILFVLNFTSALDGDIKPAEKEAQKAAK